jgi:hypothetical protein
MTLIALGMALFARISPTGTYLDDVLVPSVLAAAGIGCSFVPVTIAATTGVPREDAGLASGLVNTSRQVGGSIGLAVLATLATQRTAALAHAGGASPAALTAGFHRAFLVGAGFALLGALLAGGVLVPAQRRAPASAPADA